MKKLSINPLAIVTSVIASQVVPVLWYGALAQPWLGLTGLTEAQTNANGISPYLISLAASSLTVTFMAYLFRALGVASAGRGALLGAGLGFFFSFLEVLTLNSFELRPLGLSIIDGVMPILVYGTVGTVLGGWRNYVAIDVPQRSKATIS